MTDVLNLSENALGYYWLQVWRNLIEIHWNLVVANTSAECYDFVHCRRIQPNTSVNEQVASLASDYWKRNRFELKEYFVNWTCGEWNAEVAIERDLTYCRWIDYGEDLVYPERKYEHNTHDAPFLAKTGQLQLMLKNSQFDAHMKLWKDEYEKEIIKARRKTKAKWHLFKMKVKRCLKSVLLA